MKIFWHNNGLRLEPENSQELAALTLLVDNAEKTSLSQMFPHHGNGSTSGAIEELRESRIG